MQCIIEYILKDEILYRLMHSISKTNFLYVLMRITWSGRVRLDIFYILQSVRGVTPGDSTNAYMSQKFLLPESLSQALTLDRYRWTTQKTLLLSLNPRPFALAAISFKDIRQNFTHSFCMYLNNSWALFFLPTLLSRRLLHSQRKERELGKGTHLNVSAFGQYILIHKRESYTLTALLRITDYLMQDCKTI
jgi:hypothetical protein